MNKAALPTGPGDTEMYFPDALGDTWFNLAVSETNANAVSDLAKLSVTGLRAGQRFRADRAASVADRRATFG